MTDETGQDDAPTLRPKHQAADDFDQAPREAARLCTRCGAALVADAPCSACMLLGARAGARPESSTVSGARSFMAPTVEALGAALLAYEVQVLIGQGGMGAVYRARHRKLDRLVAIKVLRPLEVDDPVLTADFTERFEREARVLAKLDHPHIVRIYDFGRAGAPEAFFYLVLEYVDGASLRELMGEGRLSPKEVLELIPQVCEALQSAHGLGVIHRDIKPENILVDSEGHVRITDFGLAKLQGLEPEGLGLTQSHQTFGSVHYMAPEQLRSAGQVDHRADLYSLGVIVYEMLTGELPLGRFAAPSTRSGKGKGLDDVVFRALENEPAARYQGASELKRDRETCGSGPEESAPLDPPANPPRRRHRRKLKGRARQKVGRSRSPSEGATRPSKDEPLSTTDLARSWTVVAILALAYSLDWMEIPMEEALHSTLGEGFATFDRSVIRVRGYDLVVMGTPVWMGFLGVLGAAVARSLHTEQRHVDPRIPLALGTVGSVMMLSVIFSIMREGMVGSIRPGLVLAALACFANTVMDVLSVGRGGHSSSR